MLNTEQLSGYWSAEIVTVQSQSRVHKVINQPLCWTNSEKKIAGSAFEKAYRLEWTELAKQVKSRKIENPDDLWDLEYILSDKRKEIDQKYDCRYSVTIVVFANVISEGWMKMEDLDGVQKDKINQIQQLVKISNTLWVVGLKY